jgi:hypothetical protein
MLINIMLLVLGCLMDLAPLLLICTPILLPVVTTFGVDPVHFGMIMLLNLGIGLLTPPVGATLFAGCAVGKVTMEEVMRGIWPFYGVMFAVLMLVTHAIVSLWLPRCWDVSGTSNRSHDFRQAWRDGCAKRGWPWRYLRPSDRPDRPVKPVPWGQAASALCAFGIVVSTTTFGAPSIHPRFAHPTCGDVAARVL